MDLTPLRIIEFRPAVEKIGIEAGEGRRVWTVEDDGSQGDGGRGLHAGCLPPPGRRIQCDRGRAIQVSSRGHCRPSYFCGESKFKIAIVGTGAMGSIYAASSARPDTKYGPSISGRTILMPSPLPG